MSTKSIATIATIASMARNRFTSPASINPARSCEFATMNKAEGRSPAVTFFFVCELFQIMGCFHRSSH
jgi:hypothetical protein